MTNEQWNWLVKWGDVGIHETFSIPDSTNCVSTKYSISIGPSWAGSASVSNHVGFKAVHIGTGKSWLYNLRKSYELPGMAKMILKGFWEYKNRNDA
jgi:hypothetical protein